MNTQARGGYAKGRAKRNEILDRAIALFGEVGYRAASLREIATRSGISHPGLLHHFPTKEALLLAVLAHRDEVDGGLFTGSSGIDPLRRLVGLVRLNTTRRGVVELFTVLSAEATAADHPAHTFFVERYRRTVSGVERAYRAAHDVDALRDDIDPAIAARHLVALMDGLQIQWLLDDCRTDMVAPVHAHVQAQLTVTL